MTNPAKFIDQVKQEGSKVTWPTRKETLMSSVMVIIMTIIAAIFFLFVDWVSASFVRLVLGLG